MGLARSRLINMAYIQKKMTPMMLGIIFFLMAANASKRKAQTTGACAESTLKNKRVLEAIRDEAPDVEMMEYSCEKEEGQSSMKTEVRSFDSSTFRDEKASVWTKALWYQEDMSADDFVQFFEAAANFPGIRGGTLQHFAKNMVKRGFGGKNSSDILSTSPSSNANGQEISWKMLLVFAEEIKLKARVCEEEMRFYSADDRKAEGYGKAASEFEERPLIKKVTLGCRIPAGKGRDISNHAAMLGWLLCYAGVSSSLHVGPELVLKTNAVMQFNNELSSVTRRHGDMQMVVERLDLDLSNFSLEPESIGGLLMKYPKVKELKLMFSGMLSDDVVDCFLNCTELEKLKFCGYPQNSSFFRELMECGCMSRVKELEIRAGKLRNNVAVGFLGCTRLEKLKISGEGQNNSFIEILVKNLPNIKELRVRFNDILSSDIAKSFSACLNLKILETLGKRQPDSSIKELVVNLPMIEELEICTEKLEDDTAEKFAACTNLKKLTILGQQQSSLFVEKLLRSRPEIRELKIQVEKLEDGAIDSFSKCKALEKLEIWVTYQENSSIENLVESLSMIKELEIWIGKIENSVIEKLAACTKLQRLILMGMLLPPGFFESILRAPLIDSLKCLRVLVPENQNYSKGDKDAISAAEGRGITIDLMIVC